MDLQRALNELGAVICQFGPDDDECQTCSKNQKQLYYIRTSYYENEGDYYCADCIKLMPEKQATELELFLLWHYDNQTL
jgi:hypothetical protein